jgi:hypothetical protein
VILELQTQVVVVVVRQAVLVVQHQVLAVQV